MTRADVLTLLKADLNMLNPDETRTAQLSHLIEAADAFIRREGVRLTYPYSVEDGQLVMMYASYLYRKRATAEPMPRMLRYELNNRLFSSKGGESRC